MRDRLIELIKSAADETARIFKIESEECLKKGELPQHKRTIYDIEANYLLENGVIVPPCKVGDVVYSLIETTCENTDGAYTVCEFYDDGMCACKTKCPHIYRIAECLVDKGNLLIFTAKWGKTVFLTKEEAEQALRKENEGK